MSTTPAWVDHPGYRDALAREIFVGIMRGASGLGTLSEADRTELFLSAARICYEAADAFVSIRQDRSPSPTTQAGE